MLRSFADDGENCSGRRARISSAVLAGKDPWGVVVVVVKPPAAKAVPSSEEGGRGEDDKAEGDEVDVVEAEGLAVAIGL